MRLRTVITATVLLTATALGGATAADADNGAGAHVSNSPGILSGNAVQVPIDLDINVCGNTVDVVGVLNPATGNTCVNT
ncbi:chaplin [Streptomyces sp. NPDC008313]|uniref:chaplin n=1 Tax=Streptomyces sp. NPDC008313 TaxID=3364826 RepID=UPI0036E20D35